MRVRLMIGSFRPEGWDPVPVRVSCQDRTLAETEVSTPRGHYVPVEVTLPGDLCSGREVVVAIESGTYNPHEAVGDADDFRELGIAVAKVKPLGWRHRVYEAVFELLVPEAGKRLHGIPTTSRCATWTPTTSSPRSPSSAASGWSATGQGGPVLYPPVQTDRYTPRPKRNVILNVGRFFKGSHNKKHIPMIRAFRSSWSRVSPAGAAPCGRRGGRQRARRLPGAREARGRRAARAHPHRPALRRAETIVRGGGDLLHASGYGESVSRNPIRFEHFGITTVEGMAAGAVPVVIGKAGQTEIIRHDVDGYLWHSLGELARYHPRGGRRRRAS